MSFPEEGNFERLTKDVALRSPSGEKETKSPISKPGEYKKRKTTSQSEDSKSKLRRVRRKVTALIMDVVQKLRDEEKEEEVNASALTVLPRKAVEVTKPYEPTAAAKIKPRVEEASKKKSGEGPELSEVEIVSRSSAATPDGAGSETPKIDQSIPSDLLGTMTAGRLPSLPTFSEEALREARELKTPDIGGGSNIGEPFQDYFTGVDDASDISDASILLEEAQRLLSQDFALFRADLSKCETKLQKVSEERNALKLLCSQKDETIKDLQADLAKAREEEVKLDKQLREASDREQWILDSAKCQFRRETLEEIHTRDFDLSDEIAQAKVLEAEARHLASFDDEDDDEEGSRGRSDEGHEGEVAPEEEVKIGRS
ncbi:uncharacterized protein [Nicotiana tomentosiformis]|uniref:uncharacterized protein n=1 Tax=Nicotiana tomentosiformis TaxID=4098 RepID=UPI00388CA7A0